jgi:serine phosphatase RsbU (regulator of sigma subunit)
MFEGVDLTPAGRLALIQGLIAVNVLLAMLIAQEGAARREAARGRARERHERERLQTVARVLHSAAHPAAPAEIPGVDHCVFYHPAEDADGLGGDWYSVLPLGKDRTYLTVGDVIGHGLPAVEDMAQLRSAGNAYAHQGLGAGQLLTQLNHFAANISRGDFATTTVALYDHNTGELSYSCAGHPPALLRRADTGEVIRLAGAGGPVLGMLDDLSYPEATVATRPGDVVIMYTDGLVEHANASVGAGIEHLEQVLASWQPGALLDCDALAAAVAPRPYADDVCLLVVRIQPADGGGRN